MQDLKPSNLGKSSSLHKGITRPGQTNSLLSSNRDALIHLGYGQESSSDPKGKLLRQLRISHKVDPSLLASQACISLAQLYQIEQGEESLFYSTTLRQQAAKRISRLLGVEWDILNSSMVNISINNVIPLQLASDLKFNDVNFDNDTSHQFHSNNYASSPHNNTAELNFSNSLTFEEKSFASLLSSASVDASTATSEYTQQWRLLKNQNKKSSRSGHTFFWVTLTAGLSAIIGFIIEEWSPYYFIWPWIFI